MNWKRTCIVRGADFETREADSEKLIEGYFAVFNSPYWLWETAYETIDPGAFDLQRDQDIRALTNHDTTLVLGRTTAGTLSLQIDDRGLRGTVRINPADQDAMNLYERVKRGDVSQCSFGFDILDDEPELRDDGVTVWHLRSVRLHEVSICSFPAYQETAVEARSADLDHIRSRKLEEWRAGALARLRGEARKEE